MVDQIEVTQADREAAELDSLRQHAKRVKCPFCGATPHHGLGKVQHCQLHGEPFQTFSIWCPHGCAKITGGTERQALKQWVKADPYHHRLAWVKAGLEAAAQAMQKYGPSDDIGNNDAAATIRNIDPASVEDRA
jgi:hypothetical protein